MKNLSSKPFSPMLLFTLLVCFMSCKKDASSSSTKEKLLTSGSWTIKDYQKKNSSGTWVSENLPDLYPFTITIYSNNTYTQLNTGQVSAWSANSDFSQITFAEGTRAFGTFKVVTLTSSSLELENLSFTDELYVYGH